MTTPTFNKFKSTTIYGAFNNADYEDNSIQASANIQRNLTVGGDIVVADGNIKGKKLFYDNVDISSTFVSNASLTTTLNSYANLGNASFYGSLTAVTPITSDISTKVATTSFVSTKLSAALTSYALLSSATFTGPLKAITQVSTDNSTLVATTAYVKGQGYLTSASLSNYALSSTLSNYALSSSLSNYALSSSLSNYALLSGSTFTGNVSGLTATTTDNSTKFATTAFVKAQNYISSNPDLSPYALLSGATFTGNVSGLTATTTDNSTLLATTAFVKNQNYLTTASLSPYALSSSLSNYALTSSLSNYALSSSLSNYALLSGATFTGTVDCNNGLLNISQPSSTQSPILQFRNNNGQARALIYPSVSSSVLRFSIIPNYGTNGFEWEKTGTTLMSLDSNGNLKSTGLLDSNNLTGTNGQTPTANGLGGWVWASSTISSVATATTSVPILVTIDNTTGNYRMSWTLNPINRRSNINGTNIVNLGLIMNTPPSYSPAVGTVSFVPTGGTAQATNIAVLSTLYGNAPTNIQSVFNINAYNYSTGVPIKGYGTILQSASSSTTYAIVFVGYTNFALNTLYAFDPFQFSYH